MRHKPQAVAAEVIVVFVRSLHGFSDIALPTIDSVVGASRPDFTLYVPARASFFVCFKRFEREAVDRANGLVSAVHELRSQGGDYSGIGAAMAEGTAVYVEDTAGRIQSEPLGHVVNEAFRAAGVDASAA
jgi:hypothetical protein